MINVSVCLSVCVFPFLEAFFFFFFPHFLGFLWRFSVLLIIFSFDLFLSNIYFFPVRQSPVWSVKWLLDAPPRFLFIIFTVGHWGRGGALIGFSIRVATCVRGCLPCAVAEPFSFFFSFLLFALFLFYFIPPIHVNDGIKIKNSSREGNKHNAEGKKIS